MVVYTVNMLIAATLYFAAAWHELATRAKLKFRHVYIRHGHGFPNPSLRSFEVFHGLKRSKQDFHAVEQTCWKHKFLYYLGMARLVVTCPDRCFFVDGEKRLKCIEIFILDLKYPTSNKKKRPNPRREHRQHRACFWSHIYFLPASEIRNLAFVYSAAAILKVPCEIKNSAIKKLTV